MTEYDIIDYKQEIIYFRYGPNSINAINLQRSCPWVYDELSTVLNEVHNIYLKNTLLQV